MSPSDTFSTKYSETPTGQKSGTDLFEPAYQPGLQTKKMADNPLDTGQRPPDPTFDPIAFAAWKKTRTL